jgi:hypothetical protein
MEGYDGLDFLVCASANDDITLMIYAVKLYAKLAIIETARVDCLD